MPTPESMRHPHKSIDTDGPVPKVDGGAIEIETTAPWHMWVEDKRYRFDPPDRVLVTESMAEGLQNAGAGRVVNRPAATVEPEPEAKPKRGRRKKAAPEDKAERPAEDKGVPFGS